MNNEHCQKKYESKSLVMEEIGTLLILRSIAANLEIFEEKIYIIYIETKKAVIEVQNQIPC